MGAVGSGIVTSIVRIFLGVVMVAYILSMTGRERFRMNGLLRRGHFAGWWADSARARAIGYAGGVATAAQTASFGVLTQFAGLLGVVPVAAYTIAYNVESVVFMAALGVAAATGVLVGNAWGRGEPDEARLAGWTGLGATIIATMVCGLAVGVFREPIATFYTGDAEVIALAMPLLILAGVMVVADGAQLTVAQSVRSLGDTWAAAARYVFAFVIVMVPLAWVLAFEMGWGAAGLLWAMMVGCVVSLILQAVRFSRLLRGAA
jgi:MATE family multidrug resistance protein